MALHGSITVPTTPGPTDLARACVRPARSAGTREVVPAALLSRAASRDRG